MASAIGHQHFQQQQEIHQEIEQELSPSSPPKSTSSSGSSSSSGFLPAELSHPAEHFCRDCEVMFESSTSLEVHLSYHKENLLTRWASEDNSSGSSEKSVVSNPSTSPIANNNSSSSSSSSEPNSLSEMSTSGSSVNSHPPTPHSVDGNSGGNGSGGGASQQQRFFSNSNEPQHGQFSQSQYGGNTNSEDQPQQQQHSVEHAYRQQGMSSNNFNQPPPPPVDLNSHINGNLSHHSPYHSPIMLAQNHIFSPNQHVLPPPNNHHSQQPPPQTGGEQHRGQPTNTEQGTAAAIRESAEILDLDSHKVHVYQPPIPDRHFFHSPYGLPPMFGNGWPPHGIPAEHQFAHGHHPPPPSHPGFDHHSLPLYSMHGQNPPGHPPPPSHHQPPPPSPYDIDRGNPQFSSEPPQMDYPPTSQAQAPPPQPPNSIQNQGGPLPFVQQNGGPGFPPMGGQPAENRQERISLSSPMAPSPAQKSPNEAPAPAGSASAVAKTKGWKGGECKRPKTYNCQACNKWFTSSGHLKRHYGTTLHKNSIKQKDMPDEPPPPPKRQKNGMNKQAVAAAAAAAAAAANNNNNVPSPPILQNSPAPPRISPQRQVADPEKPSGSSTHRPPGHMIGSSPAFNIPSGFKAFEGQAPNPENNSTIDNHSAGFLGQPPSQQRLFNPAMAHPHQPFYPMSHPPHASFMNGFAPDPAGLPNGLPPPSSYVG